LRGHAYALFLLLVRNGKDLNNDAPYNKPDHKQPGEPARRAFFQKTMSGKTLRHESLSTALFSNTRTKERQNKSVDAARAPTKLELRHCLTKDRHRWCRVSLAYIIQYTLGCWKVNLVSSREASNASSSSLRDPSFAPLGTSRLILPVPAG
jgi:hypothetical protein